MVTNKFEDARLRIAAVITAKSDHSNAEYATLLEQMQNEVAEAIVSGITAIFINCINVPSDAKAATIEFSGIENKGTHLILTVKGTFVGQNYDLSNLYFTQSFTILNAPEGVTFRMESDEYGWLQNNGAYVLSVIDYLSLIEKPYLGYFKLSDIIGEETVFTFPLKEN